MKETGTGEGESDQTVDQAIERTRELSDEQVSLLRNLHQVGLVLLQLGSLIEQRDEKHRTYVAGVIDRATKVLESVQTTVASLPEHRRDEYIGEAVCNLAFPLGRLGEARALIKQHGDVVWRRDRLIQLIGRAGLSGNVGFARECLNDLSVRDQLSGLCSLAWSQGRRVEQLLESGHAPESDAVSHSITQTTDLLQEIVDNLTPTQFSKSHSRVQILRQISMIYAMIDRPALAELFHELAMSALPSYPADIIGREPEGYDRFRGETVPVPLTAIEELSDDPGD